MLSKIGDIVKHSERKLHYIETTLLGGVICPMIRMNNYDVYIWGGVTESNA